MQIYNPANIRFILDLRSLKGMKPERWEQIKENYHSALQLEPERREAFLDEACDGDEALLKAVASLLAQQGDSCLHFFDVPLWYCSRRTL